MPRFVQGVEVNKEIPVNAEIKVGHFYRKNSYGDTDVFRRLTYWDPDTGYTTSCGSKKIGVLEGDSKKRDLKKLIPIAEYDKRQRKKPSEGIGTVLDLNRLEFRQESKVRYPLHIAVDSILLARLGGCMSCETTAQWISDHRDFFEKRWGNSYPKTDISKETIIRLLSLIKPDSFKAFYKSFVMPFMTEADYDEPEVVAGDGQCVRATRSSKVSIDGKKTRPATAVSLYSTSSGLYFEQVLVPNKTNEIPALRDLLTKLDLSSCIITLDAGHCFAETCEIIMTKARADYVISLKDNQRNLREAVEEKFKEGEFTEEKEFTEPVAHGRKDYRRIRIMPATVLGSKNKTWNEWHGLLGGTLIEVYRRSTEVTTGTVTEGTRYFISSLSPEREGILRHCMRAVRQHWGIEEGHYCLDVDFYQDTMQCKNREFLENNILLNKLAMAATTLFAKENPGKRKKPMSLACRLKSQCRPEIAAETLDWFVYKSLRLKTDKAANEQPLTVGSF